MSHYSYLIDKQNKKYYNLGKPSWYDDLTYDFNILKDLEYLSEFVFDDIFNGYDCDFNDGTDKRNWCENIAKEIFEFAKDVPLDRFCVIDDSTDDLWVLDCLGYVCTGSIYGKESVEYSIKRSAKYKLENPENFVKLNPNYIDLYNFYK